MSLKPQFIVVCGDGGPSSLSPAIDCGNFEGVNYSARVVEGFVLSSQEYQSFLVSSAPFDPVKGAEFFAFGFGVVVGCWVVAHTAAVVVRMIKEA